jgi:type IV secretion system protein VirD4
MLGTFTEKNKSKSRSLGKGGGSESTSDQRRALMLPQELKEIGQWKQIIMLENVKPILCEKIRYFDDPVFTERIMSAPAVPLLDLDLHQAIVEARTRELEEQDVADGVDLSKLAIDLNLISELSDEGEASPEEVERAVNEMFSCFGVDNRRGDQEQDEEHEESIESDVNDDQDIKGASPIPAAWGGVDAGEPVELPDDSSELNVVEADDSTSHEAAGGIALDLARLNTKASASIDAGDVDLSVLDEDSGEIAALAGDEPPADGLIYDDALVDLSSLED